MYVFLPSKELGLKGFLDRLNAEDWKLWINSLHEREGEIVLPRFRLEYEKTLNEVLKSMGMEIAFDRSRADFSRMYEISPDENVFISEVKQKTFVEVNEEGTEAAAVTSVKMTLATSVNEEPRKFKMIVDRPFFCAIRDNETGISLFTGAIVDPQ